MNTLRRAVGKALDLPLGTFKLLVKKGYTMVEIKGDEIAIKDGQPAIFKNATVYALPGKVRREPIEATCHSRKRPTNL